MLDTRPAHAPARADACIVERYWALCDNDVNADDDVGEDGGRGDDADRVGYYAEDADSPRRRSPLQPHERAHAHTEREREIKRAGRHFAVRSSGERANDALRGRQQAHRGCTMNREKREREQAKAVLRICVCYERGR